MAKRKNEPLFIKSEENGAFHYRIEAANGEPLVTPEQFATEQGARKNFDALRKWFRKFEDEQAVLIEGGDSVEGWLFWQTDGEGNFIPMAMSDDERWVIQQRGLLNVDDMPAQSDDNTVEPMATIVNDFVGHRPPHRPR